MTSGEKAIANVGLFAGDSEMATLMRSHDWSATPVGAVETWSQSLKTSIRIILGSRYPMFVWWGQPMTNFYNDAYAPMLGQRHPQALGQSAFDVWEDVWEVVEPQAQAVLNQGKSSWNEDLLLIIERNGYPEETYFTFSYSPVMDDDGGAGGVFCAVTEETQRVLSDRRLRTLRELAAETAKARTVESACELSLRTLANNSYDVPFALLYLLDDNGTHARLGGTTGIAVGTPASPPEIEIAAASQPLDRWLLGQAIATGEAKVIEDLVERFEPLPGGPWAESPHSAIVLPLIYSGQERPIGFLTVGISPRRAWDDDYKGFFDLVAAQVTTAIANARAYEAERQRAEALAQLDRAKTTFLTREQALRQEAETAKQTVETILSSISDGFAILDRNWCFTYINDRYCEMTGMQREKMLGQNIWDVFPDIVGDELYVRLHQAMAEQTIIHYEYFYSRWNRWFENHIYPSANGLTLFVTEVSERKIAAAALRESEARFRSFAENSNDVIWITDAREYRLIYVSPSFEQVWGRAASDIYADLTRFIEFVHPDDRHRIQTAWQQCTQGNFSQEYRVIRPDGAIVWISDRGFPVYDERGELLYLGGIAEDITARKQAELMLVEQKRLLESIASGQPLDDCLCAVCAAISRLNPRARACFLLVDAQRATFPRSIAPDFPPSFSQGLKDAPINDLCIGTCGEAVDRGEPITCADIDRDNRWSQAWRDLCVAHGVLACHSTPVMGRDCLPLGSVMLCFDEARLPTDWEYQLSNFGTKIASIAIERDRASLALRSSEEQLRLASESANLGMWYWNTETDTLIWTDQAKAMFGLPSDTQMSMQVFLEAVHPTDRSFVETIVTQLQAGQAHTEIDYRTLWADGTIRWILAKGDCDFNHDGILIATRGVLLDISDRKIAEEKLRQREAELNEAQRLGRFGNWHWDAKTDVTTGSDQLLRIYGFDPAIDTMPNFADQEGWLYPHESWQRINAGVQQALSTGCGYELDVQAFRNGTPIWITTRSEVLRDSDGKIVGLRGTVQDITERKLAEAALRDSEENFRTLADNISQFAWTADANGWTYWYNCRWFEYTGTTLEEMQGWGWQQVHHPEHVERVVEHIQHCFATGEQWEDTFPLRGKDGTYRWFLSRAIPIRDEQGRILRWFGTNTDITARQQVEAELRQKNAILDVVNESAPTPIFVKDRQGRIIYANPATLEVLGKSADEAIGARDCDLYPNSEDAARVMENDRRIMESGQTQVVEESPDGIRTFLGMKAPYRNEAGEVIGVIGISNDISDRVQLERDRERLLQQEQAAREAAEQANRIKDEFLAVLSHELRSPLNPILGWSKLLQNGKLDAAKTKQALSTIERNAKLQSELIEDLLDVSRILQGKLSLNVDSVNLVTTIRAALETVRLAAEAKQISLALDLEEASAPIWGDAARLQQVVWNLLSNAVKFTPNGGRVTVELRQKDRLAQIRVRDTGKGINPEFLPHVFEYFRQEDGSTTRKFGGLGLGLAIVRQIVELHGGRVWVESAGENQGATFTVELPLSHAASPAALAAADASISGSDALPLANLRVLVVDDEPDSRDFVAFVVEQAGAKAIAVGSAIEALQTLQSTCFDILLSDIGMPQMDGYALMHQIRQLPREEDRMIPAIALTAYAGEVDRAWAIAAGFQSHLAKPVEPSHIVSVIARLCKRQEEAEND